MPDLGFLQVGLAQVKSFSPILVKSGTGVQLVDERFLMTYRCVTDFCSELPSVPPWQGNCCAFILCIHMVSLFIHSTFWTCFAFPSLLRLQFSMFRAKISWPLDSSWIQAKCFVLLADTTKWLIFKNYKNSLRIALNWFPLLYEDFSFFVMIICAVSKRKTVDIRLLHLLFLLVLI